MHASSKHQHLDKYSHNDYLYHQREYLSEKVSSCIFMEALPTVIGIQ